MDSAKNDSEFAKRLDHYAYVRNTEFFFPLQEPKSSYPTLTFKENKYELTVEGCKISGIKNFAHGLAVLVASY